MSYKLTNGSQLTVADKDVYEMITYLVYRKNEYIKGHKIHCLDLAYSRTVHGLDLLQYLVVEEPHGGRLDPRFQIQ